MCWGLPHFKANFDNLKRLLRRNTKWTPPKLGWCKPNFDGAMRQSIRKVVVGGVIQMHMKDLVVAYVGNIKGNTNNQAEGMALLW